MQTIKERDAYRKQWHLDNIEKVKAYKKHYREINAEKIAAHQKEYYQNHKEMYATKQRAYNAIHEEERKQYKIDNKEKEAAWWQSLAGKIAARKHYAKRKGLGFIPLNKPFMGCEAHHISQNFVIYIPKAIHGSIAHSIWTWKNMNKMNKLAIGFL